MIKNLNLELSSKARFDSIDGASLVEKDLPRKKFIINSLLASGLSIIAGSPKVGKSWLVLDWCVRIAKGKDVWNLHTDSGTTLYLSLEDYESRLQDRLTAITDEVMFILLRIVQNLMKGWKNRFKLLLMSIWILS